MVSLCYLTHRRAGFRGLIPHELGNLSNLNHLGLRGTSSFQTLYSENLEWLHRLNSLLSLDLGYADLSNASSWLLHINQLPTLQELYLSSCKLDHFAPLDHANFTSLSVLDISLNNFNSFLPKWITSLSSLVSLDLSRSYLSMDWDEPTKTNGHRLRSNELSGLIPNELCHLSDLQIMDIGNNNLTGPIPHCFGNFTSMATKRNPSRSVHYSYNNGDQFLENAYVMTKGRELQYNTILALMTSIDLSNNSLSGEIPKEISNLFALRSLSLLRNHLSGIIPERIGVMNDLKSLDLQGTNSQDEYRLACQTYHS
ncbi:unnamed protein product [Citrullus colocynthis]|uniref:Uncharacterized protein n=1 Tax=Citrullus colocynthis TaxID=252529 RepID=A0ABP0XU90_9ROSI